MSNVYLFDKIAWFWPGRILPKKKKKRKRILSNQINNLNRPVMPKEIKEVVKTLPVTNKQTNKFSARGFLI